MHSLAFLTKENFEDLNYSLSDHSLYCLLYTGNSIQSQMKIQTATKYWYENEMFISFVV